MLAVFLFFGVVADTSLQIEILFYFRFAYPVKSTIRHVSIENSPPLHEISSLEDITEAFHYEHIEDTICTIDTKNVILYQQMIIK
jgi:hypothetical protein